MRLKPRPSSSAEPTRPAALRQRAVGQLSAAAARLVLLAASLSPPLAQAATAPAPTVPTWGNVEVVSTAPVWSEAPAQPREASWQLIDTSGPQPSTWQNGPVDQQRPPAPAAVVRGVGRGFTVNGYPYPDISLKLPNAFALDRQFLFSAQLSGTSRTRTCRVPQSGSWTDCADGELFFELTPLLANDASLGLNWTIQSLSSRNSGTLAGAAQSLGFKGAINLNPTLGLAFGGEQIVQFDDKTDLGRNYYLLLSQAIPLSRGEKPAMLVATAGVGSDLFGYGGNGVLGQTDCVGGNNISSKRYPQGTNCYWGPVGAVSVALNDRISLGVEWFGYGLGAGLSLRPFNDLPLTASIYAMDFLGNTPSYIQDTCTTDPCETRYYGRLTYSF